MHNRACHMIDKTQVVQWRWFCIIVFDDGVMPP